MPAVRSTLPKQTSLVSFSLFVVSSEDLQTTFIGLQVQMGFGFFGAGPGMEYEV